MNSARLELPIDHPPIRNSPSETVDLPLALDTATTASLRSLAERRGTDPGTTLLAGWCVLLMRLSGREQLVIDVAGEASRSEEHTSELQSLMRISYAVF